MNVINLKVAKYYKKFKLWLIVHVYFCVGRIYTQEIPIVPCNGVVRFEWGSNWFLQTTPRILDILILQDKTLSCACVNNFKQNGGFWRHCACADNFKQNGVFWRQHLPIIRVWTWPKYNKHHHDLKNQLCRFIDMYIGKIFWPTAPCRGCPEKEIWGQG